MLKRGAEHATALLEATHVRMRPILMTTLATVFGMVPLAFGLAEGSEQRAPMGQAVISGIITSPLLTLVVVPVIYPYLDDFSTWARYKWQKNQSNTDLDQGHDGSVIAMPQSKNNEPV